MDAVLAALLDSERRIVAYDQDASPPESPIGVMRGSKPVLVSAPHSVRHWRDANWKQEEEYTAALGYLLHEHTGAHFIYGRYMLNPDPHDDADRGPYKRAIDDLVAVTPIRLLIDLHGARGDRDFAVALGTMNGESFTDHEQVLKSAFERQGFTADPDSSLDRLAMNPPRYTGGVRQPTITRYAWRNHHIPAVQVELTAWLRIVERLPSASNAKSGIAPYFRGDGQRILRAFCTLRDFINAVELA